MTVLSTPSAMTAELPKSYTPVEWEEKIRARWETARAFHADPVKTQAEGLQPFCIVIPPPNVTAALHLGHAFNNTLQDILTRYHRMKNSPPATLWMPGTDHAGIATQAVVEKRLALQGIKRRELGREKFVERVQAWKDEYEATILDQLKAMGCSCDFERTRFTMDEICAKAVREAFFRLFKDGLIYRGKRLVNWDPVSQTALADDEVEMEEVQGHMYYLRYPIEGGPGVSPGHVTVATTRPETMLGDVAVAMNPKDPRAAHFVGKKVRLPIVDRVVPIIADDYVVRPVEFGGDENDAKAKIATGFLKVTPAHDDNDYLIGQRHNLSLINVLAPDASISDKHGWPPDDVSEDAKQFIGLSREDARDKVVAWFKSHGLLERVTPYTHSVGHSYRSHVPIEPYLSDQWYVKVTDDRMRGSALRAMAHDQTESGGPGVSPGRVTNSSKAPISRPVTDHLSIHERNLPHWQAGGSTYFVTFRAKTDLSPDERKIVADALLHWHGDRAQVHLATVMPDHAHWLLTPNQKADGSWHTLPELMHSVKSFSAHEIQRRRGSSGAIWQDEYLDRIMRDEPEFLEKWNYMWNNPLKAGLVDAPEQYPFTVTPERDSPGRDARATGDGALRFYPARYARTFQSWHENIRDWCISRQIWWGHRIPVWTYEPLKGFKSPGGAIAHAKMLQELERSLQKWVAEGRVAFVRTQLLEMESVAPEQRHTLDHWYVCIRGDDPEIAKRVEAVGLVQDPDVLDTWFSSALWPISTMGWPDPEAFPSEIPEGSALLNTFNPSSVLCTAREIITLWVSRMVMFNRYFRDGLLPFGHVYVHAMIQDGHGQKMSKSLGNGVDPRDIIHSHGSDALRFTLGKLATSTQDVRLPVDMICPFPDCGETFQPKEITTSSGYKVADAIQTCPKCKRKIVSGYGAATGVATPTKEMPLARNSSPKFDDGRNFANKIWNATRFALGNLNLSGPGVSPGRVPNLQPRTGETPVPPYCLADRWILSRLQRTLRIIENALREYQFNVYCDAMYEFVWRDFCDWYLEAIKPTIKSSAPQQQVLRSVLNAIMRLLHPIMPFVTETLWAPVNACGFAGLTGLQLEASDLLTTAPWPQTDSSLDDENAIATFERIQNLVNAIRNIRSERQVPPRKKIHLAASAEIVTLIEQAGGVVEGLALLDRVETLQKGAARPAASIPLAFEGGEVLLTGLVDELDLASERQRLTKVIAEKEKAVAGYRGKLSNEGYLSKAPPEKVEETRKLLEAAAADLQAARKAIESLGRSS